MMLLFCLMLATSLAPHLDQTGVQVSMEDREKIVAEVARQVETAYVLQERAKTIADALRHFRNTPAFTASTDSIDFTRAVNRAIRSVSPDLHLALHFSPVRVPDETGGAQASAMQQAIEAAARRTNFGFSKIDFLAGNVGYLKVDAFHSPALAGETATAALAYLAHADALLIDLRENQGGDPAMVAYLSSYLLGPQPVHLNDLEFRSGVAVRQFWTIPIEARLRFLNRPVYVLTSKDTVSAGEEFAYGLQSLKRIRVVGATTAGGAHVAKGIKVHSHFVLTVPIARAVNPLTGTNWEGRGVEPDIAVDANEAHLAALEDALLTLAAAETDPRRQQGLKAEASRVRVERSAARK